MNRATTHLQRLTESFGDLVPRIAGALLLLVVGLLLARLVGRLVTRGLSSRRLDHFAERLGANQKLAQIGFEPSLAKAIGRIVTLALGVAVVFAALGLLGLQALDEPLTQGVLYLPRIVLAMALILVGLVLGELAQQYLDRWAYQLGLRGPLGVVAQVAVVAIFGLVACGALGIPSTVLIALTVIVVGGLVLTFALAFGIGTRDVAREVSIGRYVASSYAVGQDVKLSGVEGRIVAVEATSTVLETPDGATLRVPNHLFLDSIVTVGGGPGSTTGAREEP